MEKFREALKHSDTVLTVKENFGKDINVPTKITVLTGVGETIFSSEEVSKYIEELERLARIGEEKEKGIEVIWDDEDIYCGICDNYVYEDENYCKECGAKLLIHGRDIP